MFTNEEYFGVDVFFTLSYKVIRKDSEEDQKNEFLSGNNTSILDNFLKSDKTINFPHIDKEDLKDADPLTLTLNFHLLETLKRIEDKLDQLLNEKTNNSKEDVICSAECTRISGDGMVIQSLSELKRKHLIKAEIILPEFPPISIGALIRVIKVFKTIKDDKPFFTSILKFESIFEDDRDEIFRYVTDIKREIIRESNER